MIYWKGAVELWRYVSSFSIIGICLKLFGCGDDMLIICNEGLILFLRDIWIISEIRWIFHLVIGQQKIHLLVRFFLFHGKSIKEVICIWKHFFFYCHSRWSGFLHNRLMPRPSVVTFGRGMGWGSLERKCWPPLCTEAFPLFFFKVRLHMMCATHPNIVQIIEVFANSVQFPHESSPR